jgi:hypothetical protein
MEKGLAHARFGMLPLQNLVGWRRGQLGDKRQTNTKRTSSHSKGREHGQTEGRKMKIGLQEQSAAARQKRGKSTPTRAIKAELKLTDDDK